MPEEQRPSGSHLQQALERGAPMIAHFYGFDIYKEYVIVAAVDSAQRVSLKPKRTTQDFVRSYLSALDLDTLAAPLTIDQKGRLHVQSA